MLFLREVEPIIVASTEFDGEALNAYDLEELRAAFQHMLGRAFDGVDALEREAWMILDILLPAMRLDNPGAFSRCAPSVDGEFPVCTFTAMARKRPSGGLGLTINRCKCTHHFKECVQACKRVAARVLEAA